MDNKNGHNMVKFSEFVLNSIELSAVFLVLILN